jgi:hypothetical protein
MTNKVPDLWPNEFGTNTILPPIAILDEQAAYLTAKTKGLVVGRVITNKEENSLTHRFYLFVPSLDNYGFLLFSVFQTPSLYPVVISSDNIIPRGTKTSPESPEEFMEALKNLFASKEVTKIVQALIAQAEYAKKE